MTFHVPGFELSPEAQREAQQNPQHACQVKFVAEALREMGMGPGSLGINPIMGKALGGWHKDEAGNWQENGGGSGSGGGLGDMLGGMIKGVVRAAAEGNSLDLNQPIFPTEHQQRRQHAI